MKTIEVDEELYRYIASHTQHIGESASDILRRMLNFRAGQVVAASETATTKAQTPASVATKPRHGVRAVRELLLSDEYAAQSKAINRFMLVLSTLYCLEPNAFLRQPSSFMAARAFILPATNTHCFSIWCLYQTQAYSDHALLGHHQYQYGSQTQYG